MSNLSMYVLEKPPLSGDVKEFLFNAVGDCTWIMFNDGFDQWVGVFGKGEWGANMAIPFDNDKKAFVISAGQGYIINLSDRSLIHMTENEDLQNAIETFDKKNIVACDYTDLFMYNADGLVWWSDRIARDEIELTHVSKEYVYGKLEDEMGGGPCNFSLNIETKQIQITPL